MLTGSIKWFDPERGFGFIAADGGGEDLFMHVKETDPGQAEELLVPGARVSYDTAHGDRGTRAVKVKVKAKAETAAGNGHQAQPEPAQDVQDAQDPPQATVAEAIAGLKQALLIGLQWLDVLEAAWLAESVDQV